MRFIFLFWDGGFFFFWGEGRWIGESGWHGINYRALLGRVTRRFRTSLVWAVDGLTRPNHRTTNRAEKWSELFFFWGNRNGLNLEDTITRSTKIKKCYILLCIASLSHSNSQLTSLATGELASCSQKKVATQVFLFNQKVIQKLTPIYVYRTTDRSN
jgi:hypothetical protein